MNTINDFKSVKKQYSSTENLNTRISIHEKYSTNKQGFGNWIFEHYDLGEDSNILELGCGNGEIWKSNYAKIPSNIIITITDYFTGMLKTAQKNIPEDKRFIYQKVDIRNIPYKDDTFDIVIANMVLHHIDDLEIALSEVYRVLKKHGAFFCATSGENNIVNYLEKIFFNESTRNNSFTLQNGKEILLNYFSKVETKYYKDCLAIDDVNYLLQYIQSLGDMSQLSTLNAVKIMRKLELLKENGYIKLPKEYGLFIAEKD